MFTIRRVAAELHARRDRRPPRAVVRSETTSAGRRPTLRLQTLTLTLDGITADDYLAWIRDPDPAALGSDLLSITTRAQPISDRIEVELVWNRDPPNPRDAALAAGFPLTPHVTKLRGGTATSDRPRRGTDHGSAPTAGRGLTVVNPCC